MESVLSNLSDLTRTGSDGTPKREVAAERILHTLRQKDQIITELQEALMKRERHVAALVSERAALLQDKASALDALRETSRSLEIAETELGKLQTRDQAKGVASLHPPDAAELHRWKELHAPSRGSHSSRRRSVT